MFQCAVCGLVLEANELGRVPWNPERSVRYEAVADPIDDREPNEDLDRGRWVTARGPGRILKLEE